MHHIQNFTMKLSLMKHIYMYVSEIKHLFIKKKVFLGFRIFDVRRNEPITKILHKMVVGLIRTQSNI